MTAKPLIDSSETITMLITLELHRDLPPKEHALKLRKCAKAIHRRTKNKTIKQAMHHIRDCKDDELIIRQMDSVSKNWDNL